jgi:L-asparagine transporter-like permease
MPALIPVVLAKVNEVSVPAAAALTAILVAPTYTLPELAPDPTFDPLLEYVNAVKLVTVTDILLTLNDVSPKHTTVTVSPVVRPWFAVVVIVAVLVALAIVLIINV